MAYFKINDKLAIVAKYYETHHSWGHKAYLYEIRTPEQDDRLICKDIITYVNRTWERFTFESALYSVVEKALSKRLITEVEAQECRDYIKNYEEPSRFSTLAGIAKMGELLTDTPKQANDWKAKMLKAGLGEAMILPDDWEQLSDEEKTARLDGAINILQTT